MNGLTTQGIYMIEYYPALRENEILIHATIRMNLKNIKLSEIKQAQRANTAWFHLHEDLEQANSQRQKVEERGCRGCGSERIYCLMSTEFLAWDDEQFWKWIVVIGLHCGANATELYCQIVVAVTTGVYKCCFIIIKIIKKVNTMVESVVSSKNKIFNIIFWLWNREGLMMQNVLSRN